MLSKLDKLYLNLKGLRLENGLYRASTGEYYRQFCWLRDCFYESLPSLSLDPQLYIQTYHTILDYLKMIETKYNKFSSIIENPYPKESYRYLHARISVKTNDEIHEHWQNKQNDVCGELLFGIALGEKNGLNIIRDSTDIGIINKLIKYIEAIEYWHDYNSGIWEEDEGIRSSSIGAIIAGLREIENLNRKDIIVPEHLIMKGKIVLSQLLPNETKYRDVDTALLTLIYPFDVVNEKQRNKILENVKSKLLREYGCLRYIGDYYFNADYNNLLNNEAQWSLGDLYMSIIYTKMNQRNLGLYHLNRILYKCDKDLNIPELYVNGIANCNTPLGWSLALAILAIQELNGNNII